MDQSRTANLAMQPRRSGAPERGSLMPAGALLIAALAGLVWIGIAASDPNAYIRAVSGWLFFP